VVDQKTFGGVFGTLQSGYLLQLSAWQLQSEAETNVVADEVAPKKSKQARVVGQVWALGRTQPAQTASARASAKERMWGYQGPSSTGFTPSTGRSDQEATTGICRRTFALRKAEGPNIRIGMATVASLSESFCQGENPLHLCAPGQRL
jgi:hypothetical protein